jgi:hypothetical protein
LDVTLRGSYHRLAEFIDRTGKLDRIINVSNIVFTKLQATNNDTETEISARVTTYMFGGGGKMINLLILMLGATLMQACSSDAPPQQRQLQLRQRQPGLPGDVNPAAPDAECS